MRKSSDELNEEEGKRVEKNTNIRENDENK